MSAARWACAYESILRALPEWCDPADLGMVVHRPAWLTTSATRPSATSGEDAIRHWFQQAAAKGWLDDKE